MNGILVASTTYIINPGTPTITGNAYIGNQYGGGEGFTGLINDVRIYNRALSASEIAAMYAGGK